MLIKLYIYSYRITTKCISYGVVITLFVQWYLLDVCTVDNTEVGEYSYLIYMLLKGKTTLREKSCRVVALHGRPCYIDPRC